MAELSIIVVSWNARSYVQECLASLSQQVLSVPVEIVVVDNASSDGTPQMIRREFPQVVLIENTKNLGFARGNNIGIQATRGKYACLINSDVNVPPDCLEKMYDFMEQNRTIGLLGPRMLGPDSRVGRSWMRFPTVWNCFCTALCLDVLFRGKSLFGGILMTDFDRERTADVDVLNGWFVMIRRRALENVGLLDECFFMYGEDMDWSYRFHKAGWRRVYFSGAAAFHYGGASSAVASTKFYVQMYKANFQYWRKYHSWFGVAGYWVATLTHHVLRAAGFSLICLFKREARLKASSKVKRSVACIAWLMGSRSAEV